MVTFSLDDNQLRQILVLAEPLPRPSSPVRNRAMAASRAVKGALVKVLKAERLMR
jgi:hypothetical protein